MRPELRRLVFPFVFGCALAVVLATVNVYVGLRTGWWESGGIVAALVGSALLARTLKAPAASELAVLQTTASAGAAMPAVIGVLGIVPALTLLQAVPSTGVVLAWGLAITALGLFLATVEAKTFVDGPFPFPSAVATATVIQSVVEERTPQQRRLPLVSAVVSAGLAWLRDGRLHWLPETATLGGPGGVLSLAVSPMLVGLGLLAGLRAGLSLLVGGLVAWGGIAPLARRLGLVTDTDYGNASAWLLWPGVGLMLGASLVAPLLGARKAGGGRDDFAWLRKPRLAVAFLGCAGLAAMLSVWFFNLPPLVAGLFALLTLPASTLCNRAVAALGLAPISQLGQAAQILAAPLSSSAVVNVGAGAMVSSTVAQAAQTLESLKVGAITGAPRRPQLLGIALGSLVGGLVAMAAYALFTRHSALGSAALPAPGAAAFRTLAELVSHGVSAVPSGGAQAFGVGAVVGAALEALSGRAWAPATLAIGLAFVVPPGLSVAIGIGALLSLRLGAARAELIGAGGVIGESLLGTILALSALV